MEKNGDTKSKVVSGLVWRFAERIGAQGVSLIVSIVLARLLEPNVYGTIALVTVFTTLLNVFIDSGLGSALIQKKEADDLDFSSVFYFNVVICLVLYLIMFLASPAIAQFYNNLSLVPIIRVLCLTVVVSGIKNIQQAYVARTMQFKRFFFATLGGTIGAAIIGIYMAYKGYGVWALVAQQLFNITMDTIILWITVKWRPKKMFSFDRLKGLLSYGWKLLASALIDTGYKELRQLIIGKMYTSEDLAFYNRGRQFPSLIMDNVNTSINSVLFPTMSQVQDNKGRVKDITRIAIKNGMYIMAPLMIGMAVCAEPIVRLVLTDKWLDCVPYMRIFCITFMLYPIHTANLNAIKAMGRSDIFLKLENIKKAIGLLLLFSTMWFGVMAMAYSLLVSAFLGLVINSWPNRKLQNYTLKEQVKDVLPNISLATVMGLCVYLLTFLGLSDFLTLLIQVLLGIIIYIAGSKILKIQSYDYLMEMIKHNFHKKKELAIDQDQTE
ncbi:lipopolysaccharide biosynthesis protein [Clostridiales bacterium]|nr:lipopolysaccharide biosynthesis protein [Clostridiales bacterium]